jgi:hypothetical protein
MGLETRVISSEQRRRAGNPGLYRQRLDMLTRLSAAVVADPGAGRAPRTRTPADHTGREETATRSAKTGSPATIGDRFRLVREGERRS